MYLKEFFYFKKYFPLKRRSDICKTEKNVASQVWKKIYASSPGSCGEALTGIVQHDREATLRDGDQAPRGNRIAGADNFITYIY